jgi:hypothetical protein
MVDVHRDDGKLTVWCSNQKVPVTNLKGDRPGVFVPPTVLVLSSQAGGFRARVAGSRDCCADGPVVVSPPTFHHDLCFLECVEQLVV